MRKEYDFSGGRRGAFHRAGLKLDLPVYLDDEAMEFVQRIARRRKLDISTVVNRIIMSEKRLAGSGNPG